MNREATPCGKPDAPLDADAAAEAGADGAARRRALLLACDESRAAYQWWSVAPRSLKPEAYAVYLAASDREDAAARACDDRVAVVAGGDHT